METNCFICMDLLEKILSRLTVRHLLQLRCVCKSWCSLIDDSRFIKLHYEYQCSICEDVPLFCLGNGIPGRMEPYNTSCHLVCDNQWDNALNLYTGLLADNASLFAQPPDALSDVCCIGVVNGVICLQWSDKEIGLWNPATRGFKAIEYWLKGARRIIGSSLWLMGFGFDSVSNDFKVVAGNFLRVPDMEEHYKVYSLNTGTWKSLSPPSTLVCQTRSSIFFNGSCYWQGETLKDLECGGCLRFYVILTFNFATEVFDISHMPKDSVVDKEECDILQWNIEAYKESIAAFIVNSNSEKGDGMVDIWIVTKFDADSMAPLLWERLFTIPQTPGFSFLWAYKLQKHGYFILGGDQSFEGYYCCSHYDPSTGISKKLGITFNYCSCFVEGLFSLSKRLV